MLGEVDLRPESSGVVYSPGWTGWNLYPEDHLFVGLTGTNDAQTYVRSVLSFSLPELPPTAFLLKALLHMHIVRNEPVEVHKQICIREAPRDPQSTWTPDEELRMPVLAEHHLSTEVGLALDFDLTALVETWRRDAPNNGVVLDLGAFVLSLVAFAGTSAVGPEPFLRLSYAVPSEGLAATAVTVGPDAGADSVEYPCGELIVKNLGPGLAWVSPLYRLGHEGPFDPAGIPLGVLEPGAHMTVEPRIPAEALIIHVGTALAGTEVLVIPNAS